jgi:hypothetical protein
MDQFKCQSLADRVLYLSKLFKTQQVAVGNKTEGDWNPRDEAGGAEQLAASVVRVIITGIARKRQLRRGRSQLVQRSRRWHSLAARGSRMECHSRPPMLRMARRS